MKFLIIAALVAVAAAAPATVFEGAKAILDGPSATLFADSGAIVKDEGKDLLIAPRTVPLISHPYPLVRSVPLSYPLLERSLSYPIMDRVVPFGHSYGIYPRLF